MNTTKIEVSRLEASIKTMEQKISTTMSEVSRHESSMKKMEQKMNNTMSEVSRHESSIKKIEQKMNTTISEDDVQKLIESDIYEIEAKIDGMTIFYPQGQYNVSA